MIFGFMFFVLCFGTAIGYTIGYYSERGRVRETREEYERLLRLYLRNYGADPYANDRDTLPNIKIGEPGDARQ